MYWFRPGVANVDDEFPNPFYGIEDEGDRFTWSGLSTAAKCALRWRGAIRLAARLRLQMNDDQLKTLRYEDMVRHPGSAAATLSDFTGSKIAAPADQNQRRARTEAAAWRRSLTMSQVADIDKVAGEELRRLGYV